MQSLFYQIRFLPTHLYYTFLNPLYDCFAWTCQIAINNYRILTKSAWMSLLSPIKHFLNPFFLSSFMHLAFYWDANQRELTLLLFVPSRPCVVYSHCTIQQAHHHCNDLFHHAIFLPALVSQTNQGHFAESKDLTYCMIIYHLGFEVIRNIVQLPWVCLALTALMTPLGSWSSQGQDKMRRVWYILPRCTTFGSYTNQE